jgi:hypothetical protein
VQDAEKYASRKFGQGTCIAIREPYCKITLDGSISVRVDSATDIIIILQEDTAEVDTARSAPSILAMTQEADAMLRQGELLWPYTNHFDSITNANVPIPLQIMMFCFCVLNVLFVGHSCS